MALLLCQRQALRCSGLNSTWKYSSNANSSEEYQFIHKSRIPTQHFQASLPRLPVPKLEKTCERYLAAQKPLLIDEAYQKTQANVKRFVTSSGKTLQELLVASDKRNKHTSYISAPWFDMYLKDRTPVPINYNPLLIHIDHPKSQYNTQLLKATNLLISSLRFMRSLRSHILKPEVYFMNPKTADSGAFTTITSLLPASLSWYGAYAFKAYPLDMSQYINLFGTSRIPELDKDLIFHTNSSKHILVMRKGHFYIFDVINSAGEILPANEILAKVQAILDDPRPPAEFPIGVLTTENRNIWAIARHHLQSHGNEKALRKIDRALFNLVLDDEDFNGDRIAMLRSYLHSDGKNRWFDKSISLIVSKDGHSGLNFEHSWGDGVAVLRYFQDIYKDSAEKPQVHPDTKPAHFSKDDIRYLDIKVDEKMKKQITSAIEHYQNTCSSLDINVLEFEGLGKRVCKQNTISPDAVMQLGFQSAYFKQAGKYTATYESCSTAAFKHGRTETIRPCTVSTKQFCDALHGGKTGKAELRGLITECSSLHGQLTKEAAMGQGFDRHLFALKYTAQKYGRPTPSIFGDQSYMALNHNILSTSTLSSPVVLAGGFGPVVEDGYGIGYTIADNKLGVVVTSYKNKQNGADFVNRMQKSYKEIEEILNKQ